MIFKKTYYSISEVSKMLSIKEHTIRSWYSKIPDLSKRNDMDKRNNKDRSRFFNSKQVEKLSKLNEILKKNDSITLAYEILSKNYHKSRQLNLGDSDKKKNDSKNGRRKR